jgi:hypothetical protein
MEFSASGQRKNQTPIGIHLRHGWISITSNLHTRRTMKDPNYDPILQEVHKVKDSISSEFRHSVRELCEYLRSVESKSQPVKKVDLRQGKKGVAPAKRPVKSPAKPMVLV